MNLKARCTFDFKNIDCLTVCKQIFEMCLNESHFGRYSFTENHCALLFTRGL